MGERDTASARLDNNSDRSCQRCDAPLTMLTLLPRTGEQPQFRIFRCTACSFIAWFAEQVTE